MAMGSQFCLAETVGLGNDQKCQLHKNLQGWEMDLNLQSSGLKNGHLALQFFHTRHATAPSSFKF